MHSQPQVYYDNNTYSLTEFVDLAKREQQLTHDEWRRDIYEFVDFWFSDRALVQVPTSGSTGVPKIIEFEKCQLKASVGQTATYLGLNKGDCALLCLPAKFIAGKMMLARAFEIGMSLVIVQPSSKPLQSLQRTIDFAAMTPHQCKASVKSLNSFDLVRKLIIGGEAVRHDLLKELQPLKTKCYATYGMTETITHVALQSLNKPFEPYFTALPNVVFNKDERDCLTIEAPYLQELIVTNDLVDLKSKNQFVWLGRVDHVINSGGVKVAAEQLELKLAAYINTNFIVCGKPDPVFGESVVLLLEGDPMTNEQTEAFLAICKNELSKIECPKELITIDQFVYTANGKINRKETQKLLSK